MKADEGLERAEKLSKGLLRIIRASRGALSVNYERQPEHIGSILARTFAGIAERAGAKGEGHE